MTTPAPLILIVEDEAEIAELLEENLHALGFETCAVRDGAGLFDALSRRKPSLILLDIMLPGEDGLSLCKRLRVPGSGFETVPIIFLSALGELADRVVGLEIGADDYLAKPFEMRELVARIRRFCGVLQCPACRKRNIQRCTFPKRLPRSGNSVHGASIWLRTI